MFGFGVAETVVVLVLGLLLFGHRLPDVARWLGRTVVDVRREVSSVTDDLNGPSNRAA